MGCDGIDTSGICCRARFQSTHPVWDATALRSVHVDSSPQFQSTHPVWDATIKQGDVIEVTRDFNPRIPYGMRLGRCSVKGSKIFIFQSTHPVWDATDFFQFSGFFEVISIHASRMGCDHLALALYSEMVAYFNPRIPYGMRRVSCSPTRSDWSLFQSTHPVWDATVAVCCAAHC